MSVGKQRRYLQAAVSGSESQDVLKAVQKSSPQRKAGRSQISPLIASGDKVYDALIQVGSRLNVIKVGGISACVK